MKIIRDGKEFTLTPKELREAYFEQEHSYDIQNIENNMESHLSSYEYIRLKDNKSFIQHAAAMLRENIDDYGIDYGTALSSAFTEASDDFKLSVNRVILIRERWSEHEIWTNDYWVDVTKIASKELFQQAVEEFLLTKDGQKAVEETCNDFNWGDVDLYVPDEIWNQFGIYPFDYNIKPEEMGLRPTSSADMITIKVNQDEVLIPDDYHEKLDALNKKPTLDSIIRSVAYYSENEAVKNTVLQSDALRKQTLDVCYSIPGYFSLSSDKKNMLYDLVNHSISLSKQKGIEVTDYER